MAIRTHHIRAGFWAGDLAVTAVAVYFLVKVAGHLFLQSPSIPPQPLRPSSPKTAVPEEIKPYEQYADLRKSSLFGALSSSNVDAQKVAEEKLPETVDLELLGCVAGSRPDSCFAIIRDKRSRMEGTYGIGDFIANSAKVEEIRENEVVISRSGRREILAMSFTDEGVPGEGMIAREMAGGRPTAPGYQPPSTSDVAIRVVNENLRYINREKLKQESNGSLGQLISQVSASPNMADNKPAGIRIDGLGADPLISQSGFQAGDIIKSVNGIRVNSVGEALGLSERLQNAPEIRVVVERNGRHRTLVYKIR